MSGKRVQPFVAMAGMLTLSEYVLDLDLGLDQLLFKESSGAVRTSHLGRMSPVTALNFNLVGCALLCWRPTAEFLPGQYFGHRSRYFLPSLIALVGYAYGEESLSQHQRLYLDGVAYVGDRSGPLASGFSTPVRPEG